MTPVLAQFYHRPTQVGSENGLPVFTNQLWVKVQRSKMHIVDRPATEAHTESPEFRDSYNHFLKTQEKPEEIEGTPLAMWPVLDAAELATLQANGIKTVQQLAKSPKKGIPESFQYLLQKAKQYVDFAANEGVLLEELDQLRTENELLKNDLKAAQARIKED